MIGADRPAGDPVAASLMPVDSPVLNLPARCEALIFRTFERGGKLLHEYFVQSDGQ